MSKNSATGDLPGYGALIRAHRENLLRDWAAEVRLLPSAQHLDAPTLIDHIPLLVDELALAFETISDVSIARAIRSGSSPAHGFQRVKDGFNIAEVVGEYNILRGCVHDLVESAGMRLDGRAFHILNNVLDSAIGLAVETYATAQALEVQRRREEYLAFVAHDLRTPLSAISLAARVIEQAPDTPAGSAMRADMIPRLRRNVHQSEALVSKIIEENSSLET